MRSVRIRICLPPSTPPLVAGDRLSPQGVLLSERLAALATRWPAVGFHRIEIAPRAITITLIPHAGADSRATGAAIGRAVIGTMN